MNKDILITIFMLFLIVAMPVTFAADVGSNLKESAKETAQDVKKSAETVKSETLPKSLTFKPDENGLFMEPETGESIVVNVKDYQPKIIKSGLIEEDDVPVFVFLSGLTLGSVLGSVTGYKSGAEPFYAYPEIKQVIVRPADLKTLEYVRGVPRYIRPTRYSLDNLGYLRVLLNKIEKENDVPSEITLNMTAEIMFDNALRLFQMYQQDLILPVDPNEKKWRSKDLRQYSFFTDRGFLRLTKVEGDRAYFVYYSGLDLVPPYTGSPRPIQEFSLRVGQTSDYFGLRDTTGLMQTRFRVQLVNVLSSDIKKAKLEVNLGGRYQDVIVTEGTSLYPGSSWKVTRISVFKNKDGSVRQEVVLTSTKDRKVLSRTVHPLKGEDNDPCNNLNLLVENALANSVPKNNSLFKSFKSVAQKDLKDILNADTLNKTLDKILYCKAIDEYKKVLENYPTEKSEKGYYLSDEAAYKIAKLYEKLGNPSKALEYYQQADRNKMGYFIAEAEMKIHSLTQDVDSNAVFTESSLEDNGNFIDVRIKDLYGFSDKDKPSVILDVENEGSRKLLMGQNIFRKNLVAGGKEYNWRISDVKDGYIRIEKYYPNDISKNVKIFFGSDSKILRLDERMTVEGRVISVKEIDTKKFAHVRILPGTGKPLISRSNFTVHIPIEKRALQLTPNETKRKIEKTEKAIKKLDNVIVKFDKVLKVWKKVCLFTFMFLTVKNSFFMGISRSKARYIALRGADGKGGWYSYCQERSGKGKLYDSFDDCVLENKDKISKTVDETQKVIEKVNSEMKDYESQSWYKDLAKNYTGLDKYGKYVKDQIFDKTALRDYRFWVLMKGTKSYSNLDGEQKGDTTEYNLKKEVDSNLKSFELTTKRAQAFNSAVQAVQKSYPGFDKLPEGKKKEIFVDLFSSNLETKNVGSSKFPLLKSMDVKTLSSLRKEGNTYYSNSIGGKIVLAPATVSDYIIKLKDIKSSKAAVVQSLYDVELDRVKKQYKSNPNAPLISDRGQIFKDKKGNLYVPLAQSYSAGDMRKDYSAYAQIEAYPDGKPYCIPTCNGNFVKVLDFYSDGSPKTVQEWNVGNDGLLCTADDVLVTHNSVLSMPQNEAKYKTLVNAVNRFGLKKKGDRVSMCGKTFIVDNSKAKLENDLTKPTCYDTMDPGDCQLLFGVCDPVMCPPSRFNLNGRYKVDNVVQSGIIGSLVLGLHNFGSYEPVPVCLTGIDAGLKNIKSVLTGYRDCLKTSLVSGKTVGICDKIRAVYICELIWKEAMNLFKLKGPIFSWLSEKMFKQNSGGGEYLTFKSSLENVQNSVNFFTTSYASTAFSAFKSRSMSEVGVSLCKAKLFGKLPAFGEMVNQLATPENPPQYTALLSSSPYTESGDMQLAQYEIFYHIYAGTTPVTESTSGLFVEPSTGLKTITYSVYLKNPKGETYYVTERCRGMKSTIPIGGIASQNLDCVAPKGFNEVCIEINGNTKCGFGKVTSEFTLNYLNDLVIKDELKKNIKSEEDCVPSAPRTSPSLGSFVLPGSVSMLDTGISRVCSVKNPGIGKSPERYKVIGDCGKDALGRYLGRCWIDLKTIGLKDLEAKDDIMKKLNLDTLKAEKEDKGIKDIVSKKDGEKIYSKYQKMDRSSCGSKISVVNGLLELEQKSLDPVVAAKSLMLAADVLTEIAGNCCLKDPLSSVKAVLFSYESEADKLTLKLSNTALVKKRTISDKDQLKKEYTSLAKDYTAKFNNLTNVYSKKILNVVNNLKIQGVESYVSNEMLKIKEKYFNKLNEILKLEDSAISPGTKQYEIEQCSKCSTKSRIFGVEECKKDVCYSLGGGKACYYVPDKGTLSSILRSTGLKVNGKCLACAAATSCGDFDADPARCEDRSCTQRAGLMCEYKNGKCQSKSGTSTAKYSSGSSVLKSLGLKLADTPSHLGSLKSLSEISGLATLVQFSLSDRFKIANDFYSNPPNFVPTSEPTFGAGKIYFTTYYSPRCEDYAQGWDDPDFLKAWAVEGSVSCNGKCYGPLGKSYKNPVDVLKAARENVKERDCNVYPEGIASTGVPVKEKKTIAVNYIKGTECYIPYGSYVYIKFRNDRDSKLNGWYLAADTGGAFKGKCKIDIFVGSGKSKYQANRIYKAEDADVWVYPLLKASAPMKEEPEEMDYSALLKMGYKVFNDHGNLFIYDTDGNRVFPDKSSHFGEKVTVNVPYFGAVTLEPKTECGDNCRFIPERDQDQKKWRKKLDYVVIHATEGRVIEGSARYYIQKENRALHYWIGRDGRIIQTMPESYWGWSANQYSDRAISIENANAESKCLALCKEGSSAGCTKSDCIYDPYTKKYWEKYKDAQLKSLVKVVAEIMLRNDIPPDHMIAHGPARSGSWAYKASECYPGGITDNRDDPGPLFPWCKFREAVEAAVESYKEAVGV